VLLDGHSQVQNTGFGGSLTKDMVFATTVRTGSGSIDIAAANDVRMLDAIAPATIYTAGTPVNPTGYSAPNADNVSGFGATVDTLVSPKVDRFPS